MGKSYPHLHITDTNFINILMVETNRNVIDSFFALRFVANITIKKGDAVVEVTRSFIHGQSRVHRQLVTSEIEQIIISRLTFIEKRPHLHIEAIFASTS